MLLKKAPRLTKILVDLVALRFGLIITCNHHFTLWRKEMTDFVDNPYKFILENCSIRNYKGYLQHREVLFELHLFGKVLFRLNTPWLFFATGLKDDLESLDHSCFIAKTDGSFEKVSIDRKNRITIAGKKYADWITYG